MYKLSALVILVATLGACSTATTQRDLDNAPVNVAMLCVFNCSVEVELEKIDSDNGSAAEGGTLSETAETEGTLDIP